MSAPLFMKVGVITDSHDAVDHVKRARRIFAESNLDLVIHCGDIVSPFTLRQLAGLKCRTIFTFGNNDGDHEYLLRAANQERIEIYDRPHALQHDDKRLLLLHEPDNLETYAASGQYDLITYGHTHRVDIRTVGETLIVNPGESWGWITGRANVAIADLETKSAELVLLNELEGWEPPIRNKESKT